MMTVGWNFKTKEECGLVVAFLTRRKLFQTDYCQLKKLVSFVFLHEYLIPAPPNLALVRSKIRILIFKPLNIGIWIIDFI